MFIRICLSICGFVLVAVSAMAAADEPLRAFVSSAQGTGNLGSWPQAGTRLVGLAAGDQICQSLAFEADLAEPERYIAFLNDENDDAWCRIQNLSGKRADNCGVEDLVPEAGPWLRMDGQPFAAELVELFHANEVIYHPLLLQEDGVNPVASEFGRVWAGTETLHCDNWTSDSANEDGRAGSAIRSTISWRTALNRSCNQDLALMCMQTGARGSINLPPPGETLAFVTSTNGPGNMAAWPESAGSTGLNAADYNCRTRAAAAGLPLAEHFRAWLSIDGQPAADRFSHPGPWYRVDGIKFADSLSDLTQDSPFSPLTSLNVTEDGSYLGALSTWTGTLAEGAQPAAQRCQDWTSSDAGHTGGRGVLNNVSRQWTELNLISCNSNLRLYCLADPPTVGQSVIVDSTADPGDENSCTLRQAVTSINQLNPHGACELIENGEEVHRVIMPASLAGPIDLADLDGNHIEVIRAMTIVGAGMDQTLIQRPEAATASYRIFTAHAPLTLQDLTVRGGYLLAAFGSGGCMTAGATLRLERVRISDCTMDGPLNSGGAIRTSANLQVFDSILSGNQVASSTGSAPGGAIQVIAPANSVWIENSTLADNQGRVGGALSVTPGVELTIINSTITGNQAAFGAAMNLTDGQLFLSNSTITDNTATDGTGGVRLNGDYLLTMRSSIVAGNSGPDGADVGGAPESLEIQGANNLINDSAHELPPDTLDCDPGLLPLANYGGLTPTKALSAGSCAIDVGSNELELAFDQRGEGFSREVGAAADIGAFEWRPLADPIFSDRFELK